MKKLLCLLILGALAWYGYPDYLQHGEALFNKVKHMISGLYSDSKPESPEPLDLPPLEKCVSAEGDVYYGEVPAGVECQLVEVSENSFMVVPKEVILDPEKKGAIPVSRQDLVAPDNGE